MLCCEVLSINICTEILTTSCNQDSKTLVGSVGATSPDNALTIGLIGRSTVGCETWSNLNWLLYSWTWNFELGIKPWHSILELYQQSPPYAETLGNTLILSCQFCDLVCSRSVSKTSSVVQILQQGIDGTCARWLCSRYWLGSCCLLLLVTRLQWSHSGWVTRWKPYVNHLATSSLNSHGFDLVGTDISEAWQEEVQKEASNQRETARRRGRESGRMWKVADWHNASAEARLVEEAVIPTPRVMYTGGNGWVTWRVCFFVMVFDNIWPTFAMKLQHLSVSNRFKHWSVTKKEAIASRIS